MMNILGRLRQQFDRLRNGTRDEYDQTVAAGKVLMDILRGNKPTPEELQFLKSQSMDLLKILGLIGANAIPMSSIILVAIERAMKPYGISLLPTHHDIPKSLKEYRIFLDDERNVDDVYADPSDFVTVRDLDQFKEVIYERGLPTFISFDHDLGSNRKGEVLKSGYDVAKWIVQEMELDIRSMDFKVHSWNIQTRDQIGDLFRSWKKELDRREVRNEVRSIVMESMDATGGTREPFSMFVPLDILAINDIFRESGHELYLVGGCVRDAVMGKKPKDFDLATDALPDRVEQLLKDHGYRTLPTGKAFGIINVITDEDTYEVATFRVDVGEGRRPDAVEFSNIQSDSQRRDLTCNALYYDLQTHEIVDFVGGLDDLRNGIVRTVGRAEDRFREDPLRIIRLIRFSSRF